VTGVGSLLLAEFAEQHLLAPYMSSSSWFRSSNSSSNNNNNNNNNNKRGYMGTEESTYWDGSRTRSVYHAHCYRAVVRHVAAKKRTLEAAHADGVVVVRATLQRQSSPPLLLSNKEDDDVTDLLQFWMVDGRLHLLSWDEDARWWWWLPPEPPPPPPPQQQHEEPAASFLQTWWGYLFGGSASSSSSQSSARHTSIATATTNNNRGTLSIRYEYRGMLYEIGLPLLDHGTKVVLPHPHATELGPAERVH